MFCRLLQFYFLFFVTAGEHWRLLACLWAIVPFVNIFFYFLQVPIHWWRRNEGMGVLQMIRSLFSGFLCC